MRKIDIKLIEILIFENFIQNYKHNKKIYKKLQFPEKLPTVNHYVFFIILQITTSRAMKQLTIKTKQWKY